MKILPVFYQNPKGAFAVSFDEGESIWLPSGKVLLPIPSVWEEVDPPEDAELSLQQLQALENHRAKPPMTDIEVMAWKQRKAALKTTRDFASKRVAYGDPSVDRPDHDAIYRRLAARGALVVRSDPED